MKENLMNLNHKGTNPQYRDNYDRTFRRNKRTDKELGANPRTLERQGNDNG